jgi:hypothetical protein
MLTIREEAPADFAAIHELNRLAFGQDDEAALVDRLRAEGLVVASLVAVEDGTVAGHILFTRLPIDTPAGTVAADRRVYFLAIGAVVQSPHGVERDPQDIIDGRMRVEADVIHDLVGERLRHLLAQQRRDHLVAGDDDLSDPFLPNDPLEGVDHFFRVV